MRFKAVILDFDGTLVESVAIKDAAFKQLFSDYPQYLDKIMDYHYAHNAVIRYEKFRYITEEILGKPYTESVRKSLSQRFSALTLENIIRCPFVNGAQEFLEYFYNLLPIYLVSVNPPGELDTIIKARRLRQYFKKIYTSPVVKSEVINGILSCENICASEAVFIGDTPEDYEASSQTGVFFIARYGSRAFTNISSPGFKDFVELKDFILHSGKEPYK
jgi:phosphoglycolate phosphatase-like HAD superfamily hydrolase